MILIMLKIYYMLDIHMNVNYVKKIYLIILNIIYVIMIVDMLNIYLVINVKDIFAKIVYIII